MSDEIKWPRTLADEGGPAYPQLPVFLGEEWDPDEYGSAIGLSVRDRFAMAALNGMLAHSTRYRPRHGAPLNWHLAIAQEAYEIADAMLAERARQPDEAPR